MYIAILLVHLMVSLILIAVILLQAGRGGGLADMFGGGSSNALGTRASTYLTKATTVCAVIFLCTSIGLAVLSARQGRSLMQQPRSSKPAATESRTDTSVTPPAVAPVPQAPPVSEPGAAPAEPPPAAEPPATTP
ncbi:MAG: preprotein translocase subunit SecG [Candidatus Omnitrophica bacterium]|nr:preprotein translocase subunit SecG [Candidatus Omnitrophota bacterium]